MKALLGYGAAMIAFRERERLTQEQVAQELRKNYDWQKVTRPIVTQIEKESIALGNKKLWFLEDYLAAGPGTYIMAKFWESLEAEGISIPHPANLNETEREILSVLHSEGFLGLLQYAAARIPKANIIQMAAQR